MNRFQTILLVVCTTAIVGCKKQEVQEPPATPAAESTAAAVAPTPVEGLVDTFMTQQLQIFIREQGRMPVSYNEFATARMDSPPLPPEGMEFIIDQATRQVKLVKIR